MGRRFIPPISARLVEQESDRVRRNHDERIAELQKVPIVGGTLIKGIKLPNATSVPVHHGLGHVASVFLGAPYPEDPSAVTTGGIIRQLTRSSTDKWDPRHYAVLRASGWGTTMYVDAWVF